MSAEPHPHVPFFVGQEFPLEAPAGAALLKPDRWDDYSYKTTFDLELRHPNGSRISIGPLKILARTYPETVPSAVGWGPTSTVLVLPRTFPALDPNHFCALGQASSYYARLHNIVSFGWRRDTARYLCWALADVCFHPAAVTPWWDESPGFRTSLLRYQDAYIARREAVALLEGKEATEDNINSLPIRNLNLPIAIEPKSMEFSFDSTSRVPGRIGVIVGRNGAGKSQFLSGIAAGLTQGYMPRGEGYTPTFSRVVYLSYNAFDSGARRVARWTRGSLRFIGYKPGDPAALLKLMLLANEMENQRPTAETDLEALPDREWLAALANAFPTPARWLQVVPAQTDDRSVLQRLVHDPEWKQFIHGAMDDDQVGSLIAERPSEALDSLSPGQLVLTSMYAGLFENLDRRSLALLDEPENHLHPSMLATFFRHLSKLLEHKKSFAIVVTHSPIVLQETPSRDVWVLSRDGDTSRLSKAETETFGDSIDNITQYLFETDFRNSNWKATVGNAAASGLSPEQFERELGGRELPLLARTLFELLRARRSSSQ